MFDGQIIWMTGLAEIQLPTKTLRLCDGGVVNWPGVGLFVAKDEDYGSIGGADLGAETLGAEEVPGVSLTIQCPSPAAMINLSSPSNQGAFVNLWIAEIDGAGQVIGTPELQFAGTLDVIEANLDSNTFEVSMALMSEAEKLFMISEGNVLNDRWHQSIWPGERGFEFCTNTRVQVPWGVQGPPRGTISSGGSSYGGGGGFDGIVAGIYAARQH